MADPFAPIDAGYGAERRRSSRNSAPRATDAMEIDRIIPARNGKRGPPEPESARMPPKRRMPSSEADGGAVASYVGSDLEPETLLPTIYRPYRSPPRTRAQGDIPDMSDSSSSEDEDMTDLDHEPAAEVEPLSFEDAFPAEASVKAMMSTLAVPIHGSRVDAPSDFFIQYVEALAAKKRPDSEECFEMVILLVKQHGKGDQWQYAWPIDAYMECGVKFGGDWDLAYVQAKAEPWRARARELELVGASREDIGVYASLLQDAETIGLFFSLESLPVLFDPADETVAVSITRFLLELKKRAWSALLKARRPAFRTKRKLALRKWGKSSYLDLVDAFEEEVESEANDGIKRPPTSSEWEFHLYWKLMDRRFSTSNPSLEAQAQYQGLRIYIVELFNRYGTQLLPLTRRVEGPAIDCLEFCEAMWNAIDLEKEVTIGLLEGEWRQMITDTEDEEDRKELKSRFTIMLRHSSTGWSYGVKSPASPREHLWISIGKRLVDLGISPVAADTFDRLAEMSQVLAGSHIKVEPPPLLHGVDPRDYVFDQLEPAFVEHELQFWNLKWDTYALRQSSSIMTRPMTIDAKARMWEDARSNNGRIWGPDQEDWRLRWEIFRDVFCGPRSSPVLAGRFRDLHQIVEDFSELFGCFVRPRAPPDDSSSREVVFGSISRLVRTKMGTIAMKVCKSFRAAAVSKDDAILYDLLVGRLKDNIRDGGPYFQPWNPPAEFGIDLDPRARGSGVDRSDLKGTWKFKGNIGKGGFGQVSCWDQVDGNNNVVDRLILKEAYAQSWDDPGWWLGDLNLRRPKEHAFQKYLSDLPDSSCIAKVRTYGIYENIRMYRLYLEYCRHGDLWQMLRNYTTDVQKAKGV